MTSTDSFGAKGTIAAGGSEYEIFRLSAVEGSERLPFSLKVLLGEPAAHRGRANVTADHVRALADWDPDAEPDTEIQFTPARVIMQDFTGVPCVVDLATMREAVTELGGDPATSTRSRPPSWSSTTRWSPTSSARPDAFERNVDLEYQRNEERYKFLRWGQGAFDEFKVVPPGTGIVHQVNIEHLARVVMTRDGQAYPDTLVGTDSHTTMVNGLGVLGWGVGGIEAEAAMLGQPVSMLIPRVVGFKLSGEMPAGATATDLVLTITEMLREPRRGRQVRRVLRRGRGRGAAGQPRDDRQHEPGVRLHLRRSSRSTTRPCATCAHRPLRRAGRARRGVRQGAGPLARPDPRAGLLRDARARPLDDRAVDRRARSARRTASRSPTPRRRSAPACPTTSTTTIRARPVDEAGRSPSRPPTRRRRAAATARRAAGRVLRGRAAATAARPSRCRCPAPTAASSCSTTAPS